VAGWARGRWLSIFVLYWFRHVVDGFRHLGGGGWKLVAEALVERFFGVQGGAIEAVSAASVAEAHGL
jgi:hypothetical protein